jgi:hypothetical protein
MVLRTSSWWIIAALFLAVVSHGQAQGAGGFPVAFTLEKPAYVTLVVENAQGLRVRHLVAETQFPAGENRLTWDGYDDRGNRVPPGAYTVRGLTHDGIRLFYEFSFNTAGNPAWFTPDRSGAWMADHALPAGAVFIPQGASPYGNGKPQVMLSSIICESGDPTIFVDTSGQKLYGQHYFGWDGGVAVARDVSTKADNEHFVYMVMAWEGQRLAIRGIGSDGQGREIVNITARNPQPREPAYIGTGLAIHDGLAVLSLPLDDELVFVDLRAKKIVGRAKIKAPRGVHFDPKGVLHAISDKQVVRVIYRRDKDTVTAGQTVPVVKSGLEDPFGLTRDSTGSFFVSDKGKSHQVKVFSTTGRLVRTIGKPGGPQLGLYDEQRMQQPQGMAIDDQGQLWVCEFDAFPKRVSLWDARTGRFIKDLVGPPKYGGGGTIDPTDKTRLFYAQYGGLTEWKLDWEKGTAKLHSITVRRALMGEPEDIKRWHFGVPERPVRVNGRTYLIPTYSGFLRWNDNQPIYLLGDDHIAWPVAFVGTMRRWNMDGQERPWADIEAAFPKDETLSPLDAWNDTVVAWSDRNLDRKMQVEEFAFRIFPEYTVTNLEGQVRRLNRKEVAQMLPDLSANLRWKMRIDAPSIDARGVPTYDVSTIKPLIPLKAEYGGSEEGYEAFTTPSGRILTHFLSQVDESGKTIWDYPALDGPGIPRKGGDIAEPTRLLGPIEKAKTGEAEEWYAVNGERGSIYLMTTDGLFIQTLGGHMSTTPLIRYPTAKRGMLIDSPEQHASFEDEHFHPTITQTAEGEIYLVAGKEHSSIFRVEGFPTVRRVALAPIQINEAQLAAIPEQRPSAARQQMSDKLPVIVRQAAAQIDGKFDDWPAETAWVPLDAGASVAVAVTTDEVLLAYKTADPKAIDNDAAQPRFMFKTGGAFDLQVRPVASEAGNKRLLPMDRRLLVANVRGKITAVLFRPETPETPDEQKVLYESPIGKVRFNAVDDVSDSVRVAQVDGNFEVAIKRSVLDVNPLIGSEILADVGLIRGNGTQNIQRLLWHNTDTALVSDIPSEARMVPANWGRFVFVADPGVEDHSISLMPAKARLVGGQLQLKHLAGGDSAIGFWSNASDYLEWADVAIKPGSYEVQLTYGCAHNTPNEFVFAAGEQTLRGKTESTGSWSQYTTVSLGRVTLAADRTTFSLKAVAADQGLMDFKRIRLTPVE